MTDGRSDAAKTLRTLAALNVLSTIGCVPRLIFLHLRVRRGAVRCGACERACTHGCAFVRACGVRARAAGLTP